MVSEQERHSGAKVDMPPAYGTFKQAGRVKDTGDQMMGLPGFDVE